MKRIPAALALALVASLAVASRAAASDAVVLKGGERIDLKEPPLQKGNNALLTRLDGTLFSVPMSEVDWKATAALKGKPPAKTAAVVAPPSAPADALRTGHEEKARVRVTDADVGHQAEPQAQPGDDKKASAMPAGTPRVEVLEYNQTRSGESLLVTGQLHNPGVGPANSVRLSVSATGPDGAAFATTVATLSNGTIEGGKAVSFSASLPVGERAVTTVRFAPMWMSPPPPAPAQPANGAAAAGATGSTGSTGSTAAGAAAAAPDSASKPPLPRPTPYGQGSLYAAPAGSSPTVAPNDGKTGYIPGATTPDNQPKTPQ